LRTHPHPSDDFGPYRPPAQLRRLLHVRSPHCEWPGCGARASRCDLDHDVAWPCGPTCACNLGPLCRRHHRVKQVGWTKQRTADGVRWTSPTGRSTLSPAQHQPPVPAQPAPAPAVDPLDELGPTALDHERWLLDPTDPYFDGLDTDHGTWTGTRADEQHWAQEMALLHRTA